MAAWPDVQDRRLGAIRCVQCSRAAPLGHTGKLFIRGRDICPAPRHTRPQAHSHHARLKACALCIRWSK